jgi:hypothetical protein
MIGRLPCRDQHPVVKESDLPPSTDNPIPAERPAAAKLRTTTRRERIMARRTSSPNKKKERKITALDEGEDL